MKQATRIIRLVILLASFVGVLQSRQGVTRTLVVEMFTNSGCPPCKPANDYFDAWLATYAQKNRVAVVKYHAWWPDPNDPFYLANKQQATDRNTYYANNYVPHVFIDGFVDGEYFYSSWPLQIQNRLVVTSLLTLDISSNVGTSGGSVTVTVGCPGASPYGTLILHTVLVESNITYAGTNGETLHEDVMRQMLPGSAGEEFAISTGESKTFSRSVTWNSNWVLSNSEIIAFVQSKSTKEITQVARIRADGTVSVVERQTTQPSTLTLNQNYPNPFNPGTQIEFAIPRSAFVTLKIYDLLGRQVATLVDDYRSAGTYTVTWNPQNVPSGVYFYRLQSDDRAISKTLMFIR